MPWLYLIIAGIIILLGRRKQATNATTAGTVVLPLADKPVSVDNASTPWSHLVFVSQFLSTPDGSQAPTTAVSAVKAVGTPSGSPNVLTTGMIV